MAFYRVPAFIRRPPWTPTLRLSGNGVLRGALAPSVFLEGDILLEGHLLLPLEGHLLLEGDVLLPEGDVLLEAEVVKVLRRVEVVEVRVGQAGHDGGG